MILGQSSLSLCSPPLYYTLTHCNLEEVACHKQESPLSPKLRSSPAKAPIRRSIIYWKIVTSWNGWWPSVEITRETFSFTIQAVISFRIWAPWNTSRKESFEITSANRRNNSPRLLQIQVL